LHNQLQPQGKSKSQLDKALNGCALNGCALNGCALNGCAFNGCALNAWAFYLCRCTQYVLSYSIATLEVTSGFEVIAPTHCQVQCHQVCNFAVLIFACDTGHEDWGQLPATNQFVNKADAVLMHIDAP
jgi:hypothetical protein